MSNYTTYLRTNNLSSQSVHYKKQLSSTLAGPNALLFIMKQLR